MAHIEMTIRYSEEEILHAIEEKAAKEIDMPCSGKFVASWAAEAYMRNREILVTFEPEPQGEFLCVICGFATSCEETFLQHANEHLQEKAEQNAISEIQQQKGNFNEAS